MNEMSWNKPNWAGITPKLKTDGAFGAPTEPVAKIIKACKKHRCDHSNPGGIVSEYFRQKNSRI